jgi:hypothetical protein
MKSIFYDVTASNVFIVEDGCEDVTVRLSQ